MTIYERPRDMSQLDWLVTTFGEYTIAEKLSDKKAILTTDLLNNLVFEGQGIVKLKVVETDDDKITLYGYDVNDNELTNVTLDKSINVIGFEKYTLTKVEEDKGIGQKGDDYYRIELSNGQYLYAPAYSGGDTKSIITEVIGNTISSTLRIANPVQEKSVQLTATDKGVRADLIVDENTESNIKITVDKGISAKLSWLDSEDLVGFQEIDYNRYNLETPKKGVIYFCPDEHKIILNGVIYPLSINVDVDGLNDKIDSETRRAKTEESRIEQKFDALFKDNSDLENRVDKLEQNFIWTELN